MTDGIASEEVGENGRVSLNKGRMKLNSLLNAMMEGQCSETSEDSSSEGVTKQRGKLLVTGNLVAVLYLIWLMLTILSVSADEDVRDETRTLVREAVLDNVRLMELDFQPTKPRHFWKTLRNHF